MLIVSNQHGAIPKRLSASLRPYLSSLYRRKVTLCFSVTVLSISDTQLCFTSPWLSDSTHFIPITTLLISFPLLCHSLPSHRLSTPFHRFASHFNSAATFLRHSDAILSFAIPIQNYSFAPLRFAIPKRGLSQQCQSLAPPFGAFLFRRSAYLHRFVS